MRFEYEYRDADDRCVDARARQRTLGVRAVGPDATPRCEHQRRTRSRRPIAATADATAPISTVRPGRATPTGTSSHARNDEPLAAYPPTLDRVPRALRRANDRRTTFLAERDASGAWETARRTARRSQRVRALSRRAPRARRSAWNARSRSSRRTGVAHASVRHSRPSMRAFPYVPISPAYAAGPTFARLRDVVRLVTSRTRARPIGTGVRDRARRRVRRRRRKSSRSTTKHTATTRRRSTRPRGDASVRSDGDHQDRSRTPDGIAKILLTSGTTGDPKGVLTTHRML